jgi:hypothetical protein
MTPAAPNGQDRTSLWATPELVALAILQVGLRLADSGLAVVITSFSAIGAAAGVLLVQLRRLRRSG